MSEQTLVRVARITAVTGAVLAVIGTAPFIARGHPEIVLTEGGAFLVFSVFFAGLVWLVIARQPRNTVVWIMAAAALSGGLFAIGWGSAAVLVNDPSALIETDFAPADLPRLAAWILFLTISVSTGIMVALLTFGLLLFPDGKLPSSRWRWVSALIGVSIVLITTTTAWSFRPWSTASSAQEGPLVEVGNGAVTIAAILSLIALVSRFRTSRGAIRQQLKWVVFGAAVLTFTLVVLITLEGSQYEDLLLALFAVAGLIFVGCYGIAVGKYRLYDIDVVISRTVVYGSLAVFITGAYVGVVVGLGGLLGAGQSSPLLAVGATALVAFAFEPLRRRLQRLANRLVYGTRATPYEVLSDFSRQITVTDTTLLDQVARSLSDGTTATQAAVWVTSSGMLTRAAVWPPNQEPPPAPVSDPARIPAVEVAVPVLHEGELLGALTLAVARGQALLPADHQLTEQIASGLGLALRNLRLADDLRRQVEELRRSRQRIVTVQDETRRRLERDLHDGAQQRLVAIKVKLGLARRRAETAELSEVAELLNRVASETDRAIEALRDFARGIYPPLLQAEGLGAALGSQVHKLPIPVTVHAAGVDRHSPAVEAAVYFCVLEALQNVVKHAEATSAHAALHQREDALSFEVSDDGKGFDPESVGAGSGLANLADRLDALDGTLEVISSPGQGTMIRGIIPSRVVEPVS